MLKFDKDEVMPRADLFKALGHPTRLWIVEQLTEGEHCVCEFVAAVGDRFPTISRHLAVLKATGVITEHRDGKRIYYALCCPYITKMIEALSPQCPQHKKNLAPGPRKRGADRIQSAQGEAIFSRDP